jgi:oligopeptide/dipeptide ABC transporter ATP-binding protein
MDLLLSVSDLRTHFITRDYVHKAVDGVSFSIERGGSLGMVGESGSGKSLTSLSILRLVPPPGRIVSGEILFNGVSLLEKSERQMRELRGKEIAMIFQDPLTALNPVLTVGAQIEENLQMHGKVSSKEARRRAVEVMEMVKIPCAAKRISDYPHQFSGGMRQRVMIAMALICNPHFLIADEPTTALDVTIQAEIMELLRDLQQRFTMAVLLITHNLGLVVQACRHCAVMYAGIIVESGQTGALFRRPLHPYTQGLINSMPRVRGERGERLSAIEGQPPGRERPSGCVFHPRCPSRIAGLCETEAPPEFTIEEGHYGRCWLYR